MNKRQLCLIGSIIVTSVLFIGCSQYDGENFSNIDHTKTEISQTQINPDNFYKTIQSSNISIQAKDNNNYPIKGAFVCIRIKETSDCVFKGLTNDNGLISDKISVALNEPVLVIEVFALNHFNTSKEITITQKKPDLNLTLTLQKATELRFATIPIDTDHDGTPDIYDEFPDNCKASFEIKYPSHILAYEDLYPQNIKDFDMNDLIVRVNMSQITDSNGNTHQLRGKAKLLARGTDASSYSDFNIRIVNPNLQNRISNININSYNHYKHLSQSNIITSHKKSFTIPVFVDTLSGFHKPIYKDKINTENDWAQSDGNSTEFVVTFDKSFKLYLDKSYDPYMYVFNPDHSTHYDIHRPLYPSIPDSNNPSTEPHKSFVDESNSPYCLIIPTPHWMWSKEGVNIADAYPYFGDWIKSKFGKTAKWTNNWYMYPNPDLLYIN